MSDLHDGEHQATLRPAGLLVSARIANITVALGMIPVLVHFLGGEGFAAWALLLALSAAFSAFEMGMAPTFVKLAAPLIQQRNWEQVNSVTGHVAAILGLAFIAAAPFVLLFSGAIAQSLHLPDSQWLTAREMIIFVFLAVAARAVLQLGALTFNAARRFGALAGFSFAQSFAANCAATAAAALTGRVDVALAAYWTSQLVVLACAAVAARRYFASVQHVGLPRVATLRSMLNHGLKIQVCDWAQIINFQFDKFLLASFMGLWTVAPYEVANRGVLALRSIPISGLDSFLATAAINRESGQDPWPRYLAFTRLAADAALVFLVLPVIIAPIFLYAWTGEMGYAARWAFLLLLLGAAANILAMPAALLAQATGRADIQARSALVSLLINVPLSIFLVHEWGMTGAAAGTAIAMLTGSVMLMVQVHRAHARPVGATLQRLAYAWPIVVGALVCGVVVYAGFEAWLITLDSVARYAWSTRLLLAALALSGYAACLGALVMVLLHRGSLLPDHVQVLTRWVNSRRFTEYCSARNRTQRLHGSQA